MKNSKNGISMIILTIIIIIMLILVTTVIVQINVSNDNARISTFSQNLSSIQEVLDVKYALDEDLPIYSDKKGLSIDDLVNKKLLDSKNKTLFTNEVIQNGESDSITFSVIDMALTESDKRTTGYGKKGTTDYYVFSESSMKVYYLYGTAYKGTRYFSINQNLAKILGLDDISNTYSTSVTTVKSYSGISVSKNNADFTNEMGVSIKAILSSGEKLSLRFKNETAYNYFNVQNGSFVIKFDSIEELKNIKYNNASIFTSSNITTDKLNNLDAQNRVMVLEKLDSNNKVVASFDIDLSNYEVTKPQVLDTKVTSYDSMYLLSGKAQDISGKINSGIDKVRYEYITNSTDSLNLFGEDYMKTRAKETAIDSNSNFNIKLPIDVVKVRVVAIDKAGNVSAFTDINI